MPESKLRVIFVALIISRILYALSAWDGFLNSQQINRINSFVRKARRFGLCSSTCLCDVSEYLRLADCRLFNRIQSSSHCLSHIRPPEKHHLGLQYVLEVTVTLSPFAQTSFANPLLYHEVNFLSFDFSFTLFYTTV